MRLIAAILMIIGGVLGAPASAQPEGKPLITWFHGHYPPTFIAEGAQKGEGYGDKAMAYLIERLDGFEHRTVFSTFNRALYQLRERDGGCVYGAFKTAERDAYMAFSPVMSPTLPNRAVVMRSRIDRLTPYMDSDGALRLDALMAAENLTVALVRGRFYSPRINAAIEHIRGGGGNVIVEQPEPRYAQLLSRGRVDYAFGFPYEAAMYFRDMPFGGNYTTVPIAGEPALMFGHIGCSDGPVGRALVAALDAIAQSSGPYPPYMRFMEEWLTPQERDAYRAAVLSAAGQR